MALTDSAIRALKPRDKPYKVTDEKGLYLLVTPNGSRLWKHKFRNEVGAEKKLSLGAYPDVSLKEAREYFEEWMPGAPQFLETAKFTAEKGWNKKAAFLLHQARESLFHAVILVSTLYSPHSHNLVFLRTQAERLDLRLVEAWPFVASMLSG